MLGKVLLRPEGWSRTAPQPVRRAGFRLRGGAEAAADAREPPIEAKVSLLLTELVTNAVRHGGARNGEPLTVTLERWPWLLRVSVSDPGPVFQWRPPDPRRPPEEGGYGLVLVDRMARRWGIEPSEDSTTVWFELSLD